MIVNYPCVDCVVRFGAYSTRSEFVHEFLYPRRKNIKWRNNRSFSQIKPIPGWEQEDYQIYNAGRGEVYEVHFRFDNYNLIKSWFDKRENFHPYSWALWTEPFGEYIEEKPLSFSLELNKYVVRPMKIKTCHGKLIKAPLFVPPFKFVIEAMR